MSFDPKKIQELKGFVGLIEKNPDMIHLPPLKFFKDYLTTMGANIPPPSNAGGAGCCAGGSCKKEQEPSPKEEEVEPQSEEEIESEQSEDEPEVPDVISDDDDDKKMNEESEAAPALCSAEKQEADLSEADMDKQCELKGQAQDAIEDGDKKKAIDQMTQAIVLGSPSAMMYSKRADLLLKEKRPLAAIKDCDAALELNPDSAKAHKIKGLACRYLHRWEEAHKHLDTAMACDFDDGLIDDQKFVQQKWKKIQEHKVAKRIRDEKQAVKERKRRVKRAQKEYEKKKKAEEKEKKMGGGMSGGFPGGMPGGMGGMPGGMGGMPGGMGGMPGGMGGMPGGMGGMPGMPGGMGGMPGMDKLFQDPELMAAMGNPKVMAAMQEMMTNPGAMGKYQDDPEVMGVITKLMGKFGGEGGMPDLSGMGGGATGSSPADDVEECD